MSVDVVMKMLAERPNAQALIRKLDVYNWSCVSDLLDEFLREQGLIDAAGLNPDGRLFVLFCILEHEADYDAGGTLYVPLTPEFTAWRDASAPSGELVVHKVGSENVVCMTFNDADAMLFRLRWC